MIEQILKLDGSKMIRSTIDHIVEIIEEKFEGTPFKVVHKTTDKNDIRILQNPAMMIAIQKGGMLKVSFHVAVRSDVVFQIITKLKEIEEVKNVDLNVFYYDVKQMKMFYGVEAEEKMLADLKYAIINEFMIEQTQLMMLKNMKLPYVC